MSKEPTTRFGVDTGGTFTDVISLSEDGELATYKLLSTPADPSAAIVEGVRHFSSRSIRLVHGTTVATNALLERRGARIAFVTTRGFEDVLFLRRQNRPYLYEFNVRSRPALVRASDCVGVHERMLADGTAQIDLTDEEVERVVSKVSSLGVDAVSICLLHSYANSSHEQRLAESLRGEVDVFVTASHEVLPQFREYERASTTAVNAYVGPVMSSYLGRLTEGLSDADSIDVLQSNGGRATAQYVRKFPVHTVLSGPAGGVVGAWSVANELGINKIITLDMGGTSTDVSLASGDLTWTGEAEIDGLPVHVPVTDIETVGAGGGSIAHIDPGGALRVGPQSAGAQPGPASYGLGGDSFTVTDAHLVLGRLRADAFLAGQMHLDSRAAELAGRPVAAEIGAEDLEEFAGAVLEIANVAMVRAIKRVSVERGHDPSEFSMVAFGGAGGLHACSIAEELDIHRVIVPRMPGLLSAYGMLRADTLRVVSTALLGELDGLLGSGRLSQALEMLSRELRESIEDSEVNVEADLRYVGQSFEITIPVSWTEESCADDPTGPFESRHKELFGYLADRPIELVAIRMIGRVAADQWEVPRVCSGTGEHRVEDVVFDAAQRPTRILAREDLELETTLSGPLIVTEYSATTVVPPGWNLHVERGHLVLERSS